MKLRILFFLLFSSSIFTNAQETTEKDVSINGQFNEIYRISTSYQVYKVISKEKYQQLKENVLDSLKESKEIIVKKEQLLKAERDNIQKTKTSLEKTQKDLEVSSTKEDAISLVGFQFSKTTYNLILWSLIIGLLLALLFFIFKFSKSNVDTRKAEADLIEVEEEFEQHRKNSLEKEQKLRRQLQDEINKQRNS